MPRNERWETPMVRARRKKGAAPRRARNVVIVRITPKLIQGIKGRVVRELFEEVFINKGKVEVIAAQLSKKLLISPEELIKTYEKTLEGLIKKERKRIDVARAKEARMAKRRREYEFAKAKRAEEKKVVKKKPATKKVVKKKVPRKKRITKKKILKPVQKPVKPGVKRKSKNWKVSLSELDPKAAARFEADFKMELWNAIMRMPIEKLMKKQPKKEKKDNLVYSTGPLGTLGDALKKAKK